MDSEAETCLIFSQAPTYMPNKDEDFKCVQKFRRQQKSKNKHTHTHPHTHRQKQPHKHPKMQSRPSCRGRGAFGRRRLVSMPIEPGFASSPLIRVPFSSDSELIIKRHRNKKVQQGSTQEYLYSTLIVSS